MKTVLIMLVRCICKNNVFNDVRARCGARAGSSGAGKALCGSAVARAAAFEHSAILGSTRETQVDHSAASGQARAMFFF